ncbi:MAG: hypothetical protein Kow00121_29190 [Elainellaceae cyanobacterium]
MRKVPLRLALIVPFMLLTVGTSSLVNYLSWRNMPGVSDSTDPTQISDYSIDNNGNRSDRLLSFQQPRVQERPWYRAAVVRITLLLSLAALAGSFAFGLWLVHFLSRLKAALQESEAKFTRVFRTCPDPIALVSLEGRYLAINDACVEVFGFSREEVIGRTAAEVGFWVDLNDRQRYVQALQAGESIRNWEFTLCTKAGQWLTVLFSAESLELQGQFCIVAIAKDITDRKQVEAALRQNEERFREIAQTISQLFFVRSATTREFIYISPAYEHIWGRSCESLYQDPDSWTEAIHPDDRWLVEQSLEQQFAGNFVQREYRIIRPDGEMRWIFAQVNLVQDEGGDLLRLVGLAIDITDRKRAELELIKARELQEAIFDGSADAIFLVDLPPHSLIVDCNQHAVELFEVADKAELIGIEGNTLQKRQFSPEELEEITAEIQQAGFWSQEVEYVTKTGRSFWGNLAVKPIQVAGQSFLLVRLTDITERKQAEFALAQEVVRRNALLNSSIDGIVIINQAGDIVEANASFARMLGYPLEEITTLNLRDIDVGWSSAAIDQKIAEQDLCVNTFQTRHRRKDGSIYDVEISANSLEQDGQRIQLCICRDITDRKQAEAALLQSEAQYRLLFENNPNPMWIFDLETLAFLAVNQAAIAHYGYSEAEFLSMTLIDIRPPEDIPTLRASLTESIPSFLVVGESRHLKRNGEIIDVEISSHAITWQRKPARFVLAKDITDRKRAAQALRESEQRFHLVAETIDQCFFVRPVDFGPYLYISPAYEKIWGCSRASLQQNPDSWLDFVHPDDREAVLTSLTEQAQGHSIQQEYRIIRPDGEMRWVASQVFSVYNHAQQLTQFVGLVEDITDRKHVENLLRSQAEQERLVSTITQDIRQSLDLEQILATATIEVQRTLQADRVLILRLYQDGSGQVIQESIVPPYSPMNQMCWLSDCFPDSNRDYYRQGTPRIVGDAANDEQETCLSEFMQDIGVKSKVVAPIIHDVETEITQIWGLLIVHTCDADRQWQQSEAEFLQQISNQLAIAIYQSNLYQQLQAELVERRQTEIALRNSETRFRTIFAEAPVGMVLLNKQGQVVQVNQAFCHLLDYTESELQTDNIWHLTHPQDVELEQGLFHQLFTQEIPGYTLEKRLFKRNRDIVWVSLTAGLLQDPNNGEFYKLGMYENITEQRIVQRMKDNFVSVISHELRTPLTSVRGALKLLAIEELPNLTTEGQELLNIALSDSQRLVRLVSDILDLERLRSGHLPIVKKRWNIADLITQSLNTVQPLAEEAEIRLEVATAPVIVDVDGDRIIQTLTNLLSNAIKFSAPQATVTIRATSMPESASSPHPHRSYLLIEIQDQGRGIPSKKLDVIFEPFEQVDVTDSRYKGGSGLGLAICQNIVQRHGGQIWATSTVGQGSSFFFTLPVDNTLSN